MKLKWGHIYRHTPERRNRLSTSSEVEWTGWSVSEKIVSRMRKRDLDTVIETAVRAIDLLRGLTQGKVVTLEMKRTRRHIAVYRLLSTYHRSSRAHM